MKYAKANKTLIIETFAPTFCFAADEYVFPTSAETYSEDVLQAKMRHYESMLAKNSVFNKDQTEEYNLIKENFFGSGDSRSKFNIKGFETQAVKDYIAYEHLADSRHTTKRSVGELLTFNEKSFGYALGSQVPIGGSKPDKNNKVKAPVYVSYVPTDDGAIIRYECFYALSGAIPGTNWLYKMLPEKVSKKFGDFAVHAGDWEGIYVKVKIDDQGKAELDHIQTFAHGRSGARKVDASRLTYKEDGSPCIYVGSATHPSYTDNFTGRNKFMDKVGDKFSLRPTGKDFVDLSPDVEKPSWAICKLWGRADLMTHKNDYVKNGQQFKEKQTKDDWLKYDYHPISESIIAKAFNKLVKAFSNLIKPAPELKPISVELPKLEVDNSAHIVKNVKQELSKTQEVSKAHKLSKHKLQTQSPLGEKDRIKGRHTNQVLEKTSKPSGHPRVR